MKEEQKIGLLSSLIPHPSSLIPLLAALCVGMALRLVWVEDMEYKADEVWTFEQAGAGGLPWLGMNSSVDVPNPGMSLWVFVGLRALSGAEDPPGLTRAVQVVNCLALVLLVWFAWRHVPAGEREAWLWAAALVAVNPLAVLFHRKLWPPCVLPLLTLAVLWGWWYRGRRLPAFVWGLVGACLGQIHMAGFFFAGGFAAWALCYDRPARPASRGQPVGDAGRAEENKGVAWKAWLAGSLLGVLPLIPWAHHLLTHPSARPVNPHRWVHALEGKFWVRWFTESFGFGIDYTLGPTNFRDFLSWPRLGGQPTWLVGAAHAVIAAAALVLLGRAAVSLWRERGGLAARWVGRSSPTAFTQSAALWGFGLLLTLSCCSIHRHYMIVLFPLECLWVARLALARRAESPRLGRGLLAALWTAQLLISANFLAYVHTKQHIGAEYGTTYYSLVHTKEVTDSGLSAGPTCPASEPKPSR
jgi:hypothetical protein